MGFSRQEYWSGLPFPSLGIFPTQELNLGLLACTQILYQLNYEGRSFYSELNRKLQPVPECEDLLLTLDWCERVGMSSTYGPCGVCGPTAA